MTTGKVGKAFTKRTVENMRGALKAQECIADHMESHTVDDVSAGWAQVSNQIANALMALDEIESELDRERDGALPAQHTYGRSKLFKD